MAPEPDGRWDALTSRLLLVLHDEQRRRTGHRPLAKRLESDVKRQARKVRGALRDLAAQGLVELPAGATADDVDLAKARSVRLTDAGRALVVERLRVQGGCRLTGAAVNAALDALRDELDALRRAPGGSAEQPPNGAALEEAILRAFSQREAAQHGLVPIWEVRRALREVGREAFDRALLALQRRDLLYLERLNDPRDVPPDEVTDGVHHPIRGRLFFISRGQTAWTRTATS